jgi:hypothetical protein
MILATNAQNRLNVPQSIPDLRRELVFGKVIVVRLHKEVINSLVEKLLSVHQFQRNIEAYQAHDAESLQHLVHRIPSGLNVSQEL